MAGQLIHIVRAADLLVGAIELDGIEITGAVPNRELRATGGASATRLILHLPPQHVAEQAFEDHGADTPASIGELERPVGSRAAGPSRVAFEVPAAELPVDCALPAVLELLAKCTPVVGASATRAPDLSGITGFFAGLLYYFSPPELSAPGTSETAIELPFRLILSPDEYAGFAHAADPTTAPGSKRVELWHSRLGLTPGEEGGEADADRRDVRAIWMRRGDGPPWSPTAPEWQSADEGDHEPFRINTMSQHDRADIVHLSGNRSYARQTDSGFFASPVKVRRLALSSLGAWLHSRGDWAPPPITPLIEWTHRATQGRDHFVRIVKQGFLFPFCHLAALIQITERKFVDIPGEPPLLLQRWFILVRQPVRDYPPGAAPANKWHTMPLRTVAIRTLVTPDLDIPADPGPSHFLIKPLGSAAPFPFKLTGTDVDGNPLDLSTPLVFVRSDVAWDTPTIAAAKTMYDTAAGHKLAAAGANLALAPGQDGDTTYTAEQLVFTAEGQTPMPSTPTMPPATDQPGFWPELAQATVRAPAFEIVAGQTGPATVEYHKTYRSEGLGGVNHGEVIAKLAGTLPLGFGDKGDRAGGLMQPSMAVAGLSRQLGAVGGTGALDEVALGTFDPKNFFAGAGAKLFGVFTLDQVLARITGANPIDVPRIAAERAGETLSGRIVWKPVPQSYPPDDPTASPPSAPIFVVTGATAMEVTATIDPRGAAPRSDVEARIEHFEVHLLPPTRFIEVAFDKLEFTAHAGRKPDVDVVLGEVRFVGPLSFVEELKKLIPLDGFSDPPALEVTPAGIKSSFSLAIPNVAVGVFSLENLALGAGFSIPFVGGALTVSFAFCKREEPFLLTVSLFGGGGFFGLSIDPNGVQMLEAALEFGASCAINLGVAQGGVHVMAGIYFKIESGKGVTLTGYFRLGGNMSVLGLISASIELVLSFTYQDPGKAVGKATLTVEIDIFMFSMSVEVSCERKFAGSANDPDFEALMGPYPDPDQPGVTVRPWRDYCEAYA